MLELDQRGVAGAMVATTAFKDAAKAQGDTLGFSPAIVWVAHPIQNRTDAEIRALADDVFEELMGKLSAP
jgi:uncharacterized cupin superfamily protein